ncbi:MAG: helix-turn-helix domain-containing protein [archaeon]
MEEQLKKAGLTGNEAKVYHELLKKGSLSAYKLARNISMDRTLSYTVLNHLIEKGLASYIIKDNKKYFEASPPENLLNSLKKQEAFIKDLIPNLKNIQQQTDHPQEINVYEGKDGLRTFLNIVLRHKEFSSFGATGGMFYQLYELPRLAKKLKDMDARLIGHPKYKNTDAFILKNVKYRYLNINAEATTSIFGDYISIHLLTQKPIVIVIKNKEIAESYRNYFNFLWKVAKP